MEGRKGRMRDNLVKEEGERLFWKLLCASDLQTIFNSIPSSISLQAFLTCFPDCQQSFQKSINDKILHSDTSSYVETIAANMFDPLLCINELNPHNNSLS